MDNYDEMISNQPAERITLHFCRITLQKKTYNERM